MLDTLTSELTVPSIITNKFNLDVLFYNDIFINCEDQLNKLLGSQFANKTVQTTDCPLNEANQDTDPCCSSTAAWSETCKPRNINGQFESYAPNDTLLRDNCGEARCIKTFLDDYITSSNTHCSDISAFIFNFKTQKGTNNRE
jgi:hypothetical protein